MTRSTELDTWFDHWSAHIDEWESRTGRTLLGISSNRGSFEQWCDRHNHKMALIRTTMSTLAAVASLMVLWKVW